MKPFIFTQKEKWISHKISSVLVLLLLLMAGFFISPSVKAIGPGEKVGLIVQAANQIVGPLSYTLNSNMTGLVEPLPIISPYEEHKVYSYSPYSVNTSNDPTRVQVTPIPYQQIQQGESGNRPTNYDFYVGVPMSYYAGDRPTVLFAAAYTTLQYHINSNVNDLIVNEITLKAPDGAVVTFTGATANITLPSSNPDFGKINDFEGGFSAVQLTIENGLPIPNSEVEFSKGYVTINPFNAQGQMLQITVKTNKGDFVIDRNGEEFRRGTSYEIPIRIEVKEPEVSMQWSVSTSTNNISSFTDVDNEEVTIVDAPGPVYLQIRPETANLDYDSWDIDYTAVPPGYMYPVTVPLAEDERFNFNQGNPHRVAGTYIYTVTEIRFYMGGSEVHSVSFDNEPYKYTIRIKQEEPPQVNVSFQWSVSTTINDDNAFRDVGNFTVTNVIEPTPVYLRIRPVVDGTLDYDSWEINYTAEPRDYEFPVTPISKGSPYGFNKENPHIQTGSYIYTVRSYVLYKDRRVVMDGWVNYVHTIIIDEKDDPIPPDPPEPWPPVLPPDPPVIDPDPNPDSWLYLRPTAPLCYTDMEFPVSFVLQYKDKPLEYAIAFTDAAKAVGFEDDSTYTALPENGLISIPVKGYIPKGVYYGYLVVRIKGTTDIDLFPFRIQVMDYVQITEQPQSVGLRCEGDGFTFWVETEGNVLSYQWYRNEEIIPGATDDVYQAILSSETEGSYYVEVNGYCNMVTSDTVSVKLNTLTIQLKWSDVLYLTNLDGRYVSFQWYKDGQAITTYGNSIYYTDPNGLLGCYSVRGYKSDGSYDESCPTCFDTQTKASELLLYPNPVSTGGYFTLKGEELPGAWIEIYDFYGRQFRRKQIVGNSIDITAPSVSGMYIVRIILPNGRVTTRQLLVKD